VCNRVFPTRVVQRMEQGLEVEPESHECVTVFFCDIVGYTDLSAKLDAVQVMRLLERLYDKFDLAAEMCGMFKVETIGDAYVGATNLVHPQPDHTKRVAQFAIAAVKLAQATLIDEEHPDKENNFVNIRVGFHCGSVVSSVMGRLNPRFCLFGDTINTASRMESHSERNCIHMSEQAASLLREQAPEMGKFIEARGMVPIKGKGLMPTSWLRYDLSGHPELERVDEIVQTILNEEADEMIDTTWIDVLNTCTDASDVHVPLSPTAPLIPKILPNLHPRRLSPTSPLNLVEDRSGDVQTILLPESVT